MSDFSIMDNQALTMSSLEIAKLTGKDHSHVLRDIKAVLNEAGIGESKFGGSYLSQQNKQLPCYNLPYRETNLIISGYSVKHRLAIIDRWQELESQQSLKLPDFTNPAEAARAWAEQFEEKTKALLKIEQDKPKVEFAERVRNMQGSCKIGDFAKAIGMGRNTLFKQLREDGILMAGNLPYQRFIDDGRFIVIEQTPFTDSSGKDHPSFTTYITGKGQVWLEKKYREPVNQAA